ncbi:electron transfer flavoprotein subunit alpha/FixB family protein [Halorubrum sp. BOL3-1]|uniref:electron transfer flavoprotein subunit alpha/FixB family protein n=1 Tax=Halorubrum sp. BOL3-1 TaxID=2497325 RepID=UPI001004F0C6|nr:electron transfer flavoprotein subunit alpha/FixB family protein [Halorubrum sp. BOL3-1]QAU11949.1 electron transfer flavoprotein subunit alpha/FixB family protein [Halorubrum sp. BOL3-1]
MVLALVEHEGGAVADTSLETATLAREIAAQEDESLEAIGFGTVSGETADRLGEYGVDTVHGVAHEGLTDYAPVAWAKSVRELVDAREPSAVVAPGTDRGNETIAHLAAIADLPLAANVVDVDAGDSYEVTRHRWGGSLREYAEIDADPNLLAIAPHEVAAAPAAEVGAATLESHAPDLDESDRLVRVERREEADTEGVALDQARVVVGGGRGVGSAEGFDKLEELADLLDGAVGSSRAAVNEGWRPHDDQIGQTGTKIAPELYVATGISGAVQHWVGCKSSENVLAINTDPEAAIIGKADYAVIADLHDVVPEINRTIREKHR